MITRRIYVDSRHAVSGHAGNFLYELPEQVALPKDAVAYVTDICLPHSFRTVDTSNQNMYIIENATHGRRIELPNQHYDVVTLGAQLQTSLNQAQDAPGRTGKSVSGSYTVTYSAVKNEYVIALSGGDTFRYMSEAVLGKFDGNSDFAAAGGIKATPFASVDDLLGLRRSTHASSAVLTTGSIDVRNYHNLYLHSSTLTNYHTIGPMGVKSVLCRIPVNSSYGDTIYKQHSGLVHDYLECGGVALRTMQFSLRDANNSEVTLNGGNLSFTLLFVEKPLI